MGSISLSQWPSLATAASGFTRRCGRDMCPTDGRIPWSQLQRKASPLEELRWPYPHGPHRIDEIESEKWEELKMLLTGSSRVGPRHDKEPTLEYRHTPTLYLGRRGSVLVSRLAQLKVVEQFYISCDDKILGEMPDFDFHLSLKSYLIHRALVEQELFSRVEQVRAFFLKLQEESESRKVDLEKVLAAKEDELVRWRRSEDRWR
ncbi:uncharacterized protein A4U43_C02F15960 [Asparagus officinalis]|uniref:Uncharacterized protein n=1 Tax=Asparagus officinalis TaxID=4686 RepID=A0A5P1FMM5_ASPOF|nr:uncharacterized protein A4U43_C02F15960 [Asparagus officinalis]